MDIWYRIWIYVLPVPMWLAEYVMRTIMKNPDVNDFFPPGWPAGNLDQKFWIGAIPYAIAFALNEWKERV